MQSKIDSEIRQCVDGFVAEVTALVRQAAVEAVQDALGAQTSRAGPRPTSPRTRLATKPKSGKRIRRTEADLERAADDILSFVAQNPGQRLGDIARALGMETKDARRPAFALVDAGKLRTEGERGGTRYFTGASRKAASIKKKTRKKKTARKRGKRAA